MTTPAAANVRPSNILLIAFQVNLRKVLWKNAKKIVTDSGGLQREAFFAGKKCVTILDFVCWPETMVSGRNELSSPNAEEIIKKLEHEQFVDDTYQPFGDGHSAVKIVEAMEQHYGGGK